MAFAARSAMSTASLLKTSASCSLGSTSRLFSTTAPTLGKSPPGKGKMAIKKAKREERLAKLLQSGQAIKEAEKPMNLAEATKLFQAVEVTRPMNAYELHIVTTISSHQTNALRGRVALPNEAKKRSETFLIFAEDGSQAADAVKALKEASPNVRENIVVGGSELIQDVIEGKGAAKGLSYTKVLSTQTLLPSVSKALARSLGPKGLMPNIKRGTVVNSAQEMEQAIREGQGSFDWRGDRNGVVRGGEMMRPRGYRECLLTLTSLAIGRINFSTPELRDNISAFLQAIVDKVGSGLASGSAQVGVFVPNAQGELNSQTLKKGL